MRAAGRFTLIAGLGALLGAGGAASLPTALDAQAAPRAPQRPVVGRVALTTVGPENLCAQEEAAGARLARTPEGFALLRMRSELDAAARLETVRPASGGVTGRRLASVRGEVDSLVRALESLLLAAPRRDQVAAFETRRDVTGRVRQLAPAVDAVVEAALARVVGAPAAAPSGYLGVTMSSVPLRTSLQAGYIVSYCDYPVVEAVDPGSPAERAGLAAGDTILAFNGRDVRAGMVDYTTLLEPNRTLRVRVRRDGRARDVSVAVQPRPAPAPVRVYARSVTGTVARPPAAPVAPTAPSAAAVAMVRGEEPVGALRGEAVFESLVATMRRGGAGDSGRVFVFRREEGPAVAAIARDANAAPSPGMLTIFANADDAMVGGAQLRTLTAELRSALSLPEGVLVLQVLRGTPASAGGLREGDVIRAANGAPVRRVDDVRVALEAGLATRSLALRVARNDAAERTVTMRW
jgi:serine protease Do